MNLLNPFWARKKIAVLDADKDAREVVHLAFEVRYGMPLFTHAIFSVAFARQAAIPSIAEVLYRGGKGAIITNPRKRNNDTLLFFGEFFKHGDSEKVKAIVSQLNSIHARFPITNEQNLYTLATLMCEPRRMGTFLTGSNLLSEKENRALFVFWKRMGALMNITDLPENENDFYSWYLQFEKEHYAYSDAGHKIVLALADEFAERWHRGPLKNIGRNFYFSLFDEHLITALKIPKPPFVYGAILKAVLNFYLTVIVRYMPDASERSIIDFFSKDYKNYHIEKVGPK